MICYYPAMTDTQKVRERFKRIRKKLNKALAAVAIETLVAAATLSRFERGLDVRSSTLDRIAEWLKGKR